MSDSLYYEKPVLLNRDKHRHRRVKPGADFSFAARANSLYLAGVEFNEACKEYAIVFTRLGGRVAARRPQHEAGQREHEHRDRGGGHFRADAVARQYDDVSAHGGVPRGWFRNVGCAAPA